MSILGSCALLTFLLHHCSVLHFQGMSLPQNDILERFRWPDGLDAYGGTFRLLKMFAVGVAQLVGSLHMVLLFILVHNLFLNT